MKKKYKVFKILGILLIILSVLSLGYTIYSLTLLNKIETFYRIMGSILLILLLITLIYSIVDSIRFAKKKKFIVSSILTIILIAATFVLGYFINKVYDTLGNMTTTQLTYKTALIAIEDKGKIEDLKDIKIGIVDNEEDISGYILPQVVIEKYSLKDNNEIIKVSDTITLMTMLLNKELDAIFISNNYKSMFLSIDTYDQENTNLIEITTYEEPYEKKETISEDTSTNTEITEPFTILLLGIDSTEDGIGDASSYNGDAIMLLAVDPETLHVTMFSIPRDTYVKMACGSNSSKINAAAWGGTYCMVRTVENFTGIGIDYYATINFRGVVDLVDALGGITIDVPMTFCETDSLREGEMCLNEGVQTLNGEQALAVARHRHSLLLGDFQRGQNQQVVVEGLLNAVKSLRSVTDFYNVFNTVSKNINTNMSVDEMLSLYNVFKSILLKSGDVKPNITKTWLTGYNLYYNMGNDFYTYTFQYYKGSLADIVNAIRINLGEIEQEEIKTFSFSVNEEYERPVIGYSYSYAESHKELMPSLIGMSESEARAWGVSRGLSVSVEYREISGSQANDGTVIDQSIWVDDLVERNSSLTITVANVTNEDTKEDDDENNNSTETSTETEDNKEKENESGNENESGESGESENNNNDNEEEGD